MNSRQFFHTLLCLLGAFNTLRAAELPTTVQFDIIFPRNNTVYKPVYPFPVVFGLHNGSAAWSYVITWDWDILSLDTEPGGKRTVASGGWIPGVPGVETPAAPPNPYLIIDPVEEIVNTTSRNFFMRYGFAITHSCNESARPIKVDPYLTVSFDDGIYFSLDPENGELPDLTAAGPCATPVGSIGIQKEIPNIAGSWNDVCPVLAPGPQPTQSCALPIHDTIATQVAARMLNYTECPDQTWPNVTGLVGKCRPKTSGQDKLWGDAILFTSVAVFTCFITLYIL